MTAGPSRDRDLSAWAAEQARLLREGASDQVDVSGLAEEIERLGARQGELLRRCLTLLVSRLLMWKYLPGARLPFWEADIGEQRREVGGLIDGSPSLAGELADIFVAVYGPGRARVAAETGIDVDLLPDVPPFTLAEARDEGFLPLEPGLGLYDDLARIDAHVAEHDF